MASLIDALLLEEPLKDAAAVVPKEIWFALRSDRQLGSGSLTDPFDCSTIQEASKNITQIVRLSTSAPDNTIAIATCPQRIT
jgi:hypothetical protein